MNKSLLFKLVNKFCLFSYIVLSLFLIYHASLDGDDSSNASNNLGGEIAEIINGGSNDQTNFILPEKIIINNIIPSAYVNENLQIDAFVYPKNSSFLSLKYESDNPNIASVDANGFVSFISEGNVNIKVSSLSFEEVYNVFTVEVIKAELFDINIKIIKDGNEIKNDKDLYILENKETYSLINEFVPVFFKGEITYIFDEDLISIEKGQIITKNISDLSVIKIVCDDFIKEIKIKIIKNGNDYVYLENIVSNTNVINISLGELINLSNKNIFNVNYVPSNASNKNLYYVPIDSNIIDIKGDFLKAKKIGTTSIKIISSENENISIIVDVIVEEVDIESFDVTINNLDIEKLNIENEYVLTIENVKPYNASYNFLLDKKYISFKSSDENILKIDENGKLILLKEGKVSIVVEMYNYNELNEIVNSISKSIDLSILDYDLVDDFTYSINDELKVLYSNNVYNNFSDYFVINDFYNDGLIVNSDFSKDFTIKLESKIEGVEYVDGNLHISNISNNLINFSICHNDTSLIKSFSFVCISKIDPIDVKDEYFVGEVEELNFKNNLNNCLLRSSEYYDDYFKIVSRFDNGFSIECLKIGNFYIEIIPYYDDVLLEDYALTIDFKIVDKLINEIDLNFKYRDNEEDISFEKNDNVYDVVCNNLSEIILDINFLPFSNPSLFDIDISISDNDILSYDGGIISILNIGEASIIIEDNISHTKAFINIVSKNIIEFEQNNPISIKHEHLSYNEEIDSYFIKNGYSGNIEVNFTENSTFKNVLFSSSDESILIIGSDGVFSPIKEGNAIINVLIDDGENRISFDLKFTVERQKLIEDLSAFFFKFRKNIGHFAAFFVLGVLASFAFLLLFDIRKWYISIPLTFVSGLGIALITEFIQLFVPGRYGSWSDVFLDMYGFMLSFVIILVFYVFISLFKIKKTKRI